jgi:hypothetical protein
MLSEPKEPKYAHKSKWSSQFCLFPGKGDTLPLLPRPGTCTLNLDLNFPYCNALFNEFKEIAIATEIYIDTRLAFKI